MLAQIRSLDIIVFAASELSEAVEITSDGKAVVRWTALATFFPFCSELIVHTLSIFVQFFCFVESISGEWVLDRLFAERVFIQSNVPARLDIIVVCESKLAY